MRSSVESSSVWPVWRMRDQVPRTASRDVRDASIVSSPPTRTSLPRTVIRHLREIGFSIRRRYWSLVARARAVIRWVPGTTTVVAVVVDMFRTERNGMTRRTIRRPSSGRSGPDRGRPVRRIAQRTPRRRIPRGGGCLLGDPGGDAENRTRVDGFAGRCLNHSATSPEDREVSGTVRRFDPTRTNRASSSLKPSSIAHIRRFQPRSCCAPVVGRTSGPCPADRPGTS